MGYAVKLIIGNFIEYSLFGDDLNFFSVEATVELHKSNVQLFDCPAQSMTRCYFYGSDGNTRITKDDHGAEFYPKRIKDVINALKGELKETPNRQSNLWALALLESIDKDTKGFSVLFYGH